MIFYCINTKIHWSVLNNGMLEYFQFCKPLKIAQHSTHVEKYITYKLTDGLTQIEHKWNHHPGQQHITSTLKALCVLPSLSPTSWRPCGSESTVFSFYSFSFMVSCPLICLVTFACCMLYFKISFRNNLRPRILSSSQKLSVCFSPGTGGTHGPGYHLNTHNKPWNILSWATKGLDMDLCPCEDKLTSRLSLFCGPNEKVGAVQNQTESPILEVPRFWLFSSLPPGSFRIATSFR